MPSAVVLRPTDRLVLLVIPAAKPVNEPLFVVAAPVAPPMLPSNASGAPAARTVLVTLNARVGLAPTCRLSKFTGLGVTALAVA